MATESAGRAGIPSTKVLLVASILLVVFLSWIGVMDRVSERYVDASFNKSVAAFATARAINGAVSVAQSATVSFGIGAEAEISPGEVLDPVNDLVEDYSSVMKLAIISLVIQKTLLLLVSEPVFKILLTLSGVALCASILLKVSAPTNLLFKIFASLAFLRFILVAVVLLNGMVDHAFINKLRDAKVERLEGVPGELEKSVSTDGAVIGDPLAVDLAVIQRDVDAARIELASSKEKLSAARPQGLVDRLNPLKSDAAYEKAAADLKTAETRLNGLLTRQCEAMRLSRSKDAEAVCDELPVTMRAKNMVASVGEAFSSAGKAVASAVDVAALKRKVEEVVDDMVASMALFILQTLILPLLFLFLLSKAMKSVWGVDLRELATKSKNAVVQR